MVIEIRLQYVENFLSCWWKKNIRIFFFKICICLVSLSQCDKLWPPRTFSILWRDLSHELNYSPKWPVIDYNLSYTIKSIRRVFILPHIITFPIQWNQYVVYLYCLLSISSKIIVYSVNVSKHCDVYIEPVLVNTINNLL